ncbi:hypothetical protein ACHAXR_010186 [Thalassiosira sp. AJA248-18]
MAIKPSFIFLFIASQSFCVATIFRPLHPVVRSIRDGWATKLQQRGTRSTTSCCPCSSSMHHQRHAYPGNLDHDRYRRRIQFRNHPLAFLHHARSTSSLTKTTTQQSKPSSSYYHHTKQQTKTSSSSSSSSSSSLFMSLIPIPVNNLQEILPTPYHLTPNGDQYVSYFGRTPRQRFNSLFEGVGIAFLGSMFAYFISFVIGQFLATILGVIFLFWPILSPEFKAYQRNWELVGGRDLVDVWMDDDDVDQDGNGYWERGIPEDKRGLYGAYYVTRIEDVCVVDDVQASADDEYDLEEFSGYTMANDELEGVTGLPWKLRLRLSDEEGREMQVHSRMSEEYLDIAPGMNAVGVLLSTSKRFGELAGMTDFCVLDEVDGAAVAWVGDYPYLDKDMFLRTMNENGVTDRLLEFEEDEEEDDFLYDSSEEEESYGSGEEEEAEEYINVR